MESSPPRWQLVTAFAAIYIIWGSTYLAIRFAVETMPPFLMAGTRFLSAGLMLFAWSRWRGAAPTTRANWRAALIVGGLLLLGGNGLVVWAEQTVVSSLAALLITTVPLWMVVLDALRPGGQRPTGLVLLGLALGFLGTGLLVWPENGAGAESLGSPLGIVALLLAALSWSAGSLYSRRAALPGDPLMATAIEMIAGGGLLILVGSVLGEWGRLALDTISLESFLAYLYLIVFGSLIAFTAYVWLLRVSTPARVGTYAYVNPLVAVFLGWALGNEPITGRILLAAAVIIAAVVLITSRRAPAPPPAVVAAHPAPALAISEEH